MESSTLFPANITGVFKRYEISPEFQGYGHGLGFGDINGDGRNELILAKGYVTCDIKELKPLKKSSR